MRNLLLWILFYTLLLASSQIVLKSGAAQIGGISFKSFGDLFPLVLTLITNPLVVLGTLLMAASFFLWLYILSWFKLSVAFPLTASIILSATPRTAFLAKPVMTLLPGASSVKPSMPRAFSMTGAKFLSAICRTPGHPTSPVVKILSW